MTKKIKTPEPNTTISFNGEQYVSDDNGHVMVPDAAVKVFVESHGCMDPEAEHKFGLSVKTVAKGKHIVVDKDGVPLHSGKFDYSTAVGFMKNWTPDESEPTAPAGGEPANGKKKK